MSRAADIRAHIAEIFPDSSVEAIEPLGVDVDDEVTGEVTEKGFGYGKPVRVRVADSTGGHQDLVFHTATANQFGHDFRADRAHDMLLAYDTFPTIPQQVEAVDVGAVADNGALVSLRDTDEFYLITRWADGVLYAEDLRRVARRCVASDRDRRRTDQLADYLIALHRHRVEEPGLYLRAIRDLVGSGEGIYGIVDGYPEDAPGAPRARLAAIEAYCATWRWRLRGRESRLTRTHGDFHPFNILFDDLDNLRLLDASRGCVGDPADDVTCLAINYLFFALADPTSWRRGLGPLWHRFWRRYLDGSGDDGLLDAAPPYLAWRALVLANPIWYPAVTPSERNHLLNLAENALEDGRFDPESAERLFQ